LPKVAEKGPKKFFEEFPSFTGNERQWSETMSKFNLQFCWPFGWTLFCFLCENWPRFCQNWPTFLHVLTGK
jgi:hypothetical protein